MLELRTAEPEELETVCCMYEEICAAQAGDPCGPDWHYGVYPCREDLEEALAAGELWLGLDGGTPAAAMVVRRGEDAIYRGAPWTVTDEPIRVLHLFAVRPAFRGRGLAREALRALFARFAREGARAVHLDVIKGNLAAERLYRSVGFQFVEERAVWYPDTGDNTVRLYEFPAPFPAETDRKTCGDERSSE